MTSKTRSASTKPYGGPAGGWGSAKSAALIIVREQVPLNGPRLLSTQNKPEGYMCVSCARAKPSRPHPLELCENGAKATAWEITPRRAAPAFFAKHHNLEDQGRLKVVPETAAVEVGSRKLRLSVQMTTKLNRSHVLHGEIAYLLPCLGRIELDQQATGPQAVSIESSIAHFHGSRGQTNPASPAILSEPAIVAGIAKATLGKTKVPWDAWVGNYAEIRDAIEGTYPETFKDFNNRLFKPGGFARPLPARERKWVTQCGKVNFITPDRLFPELSTSQNADVLHLATLRSNDQFNTSIYGYSDRFRGVNGMRNIVFLNPEDIARLGFADGEIVDLTTAIDEATARTVTRLRVVSYNIPEGCCGAYFPETNPLLPLAHHDPKSKRPSYKLLPVRLSRSPLTLDD